MRKETHSNNEICFTNKMVIGLLIMLKQQVRKGKL